MRILAIDPGNIESAFVIYDNGEIIDKGKVKNQEMLYEIDDLTGLNVKHLAIEMIASYGMPVGETVFETCLWTGRFIERWDGYYTKIKRIQVKSHLCHSGKAKDANIRQAIIDRYPAIGGGKIPQIGTKSKPGALYGVSKDIWAALAVAITFDELYARDK